MADCIVKIFHLFSVNAYMFTAAFLCSIFLYHMSRINGINILRLLSFLSALFFGVILLTSIATYFLNLKIRMFFELFLMHKDLIFFLVLDIVLGKVKKEKNEEEECESL